MPNINIHTVQNIFEFLLPNPKLTQNPTYPIQPLKLVDEFGGLLDFRYN